MLIIMNKKTLLSMILISILFYIIINHSNIEFNNIFLLIGASVVLYYIYSTNFNNRNNKNNNHNDHNNDVNNSVSNVNSKKKNVTFDDNIDVITINEHFDNSNNSNNIHAKTDKIANLNLIDDNLLDQSIGTNINTDINTDINATINVDFLTSTDRNKMFAELESEIDKQYKSLNVEKFNDVEKPMMNNLIPNSIKIKNSDINPVLNYNAYDVNIDDNLTIWEQYDRATTNGSKQFNGLENLENNYLSDAYLIDNNKMYGNSSFDTYSLV